MRLWLLRHGEAEPSARSDAERCLTAHGRQQVRDAAVQLHGRPLSTILVSPYVRAQQTAALVVESLGYKAVLRTVPWLTPDSDLRQVLRELDGYPGDEWLLVSHQPLVGALAGLLINGHRQQPLAMHTASLAELQGELAAAGSMELLTLLHPPR